MGNQHTNRSKQSTSSDNSLSQHKLCSIDFPLRLHSTSSSSDSEPNNNRKYSYMMDDSVILQSASQNIAPIKVRKVSRAASVGRIHRRRNIPGLGSFGSKTDVMSDSAKAAVSEAWQAILVSYDGDSTQIGLGIYQRIFDAQPELKEVFSVPADVTDIRSYVPFHRSSKLFISVIDLCIRNIYTLEAEMGPVLIMYGRRHYHRQSQGFHLCYLAVFTQCIMDFINDSLGEDERSEESEEAWRLLLAYICGRIAEGFELERHRTCSMRRKSVL